MEKLILLPQFIDRSNRTVYHVHEADPDCRTLRAGKMIAMMRLDPEGEAAPLYESCEQSEMEL